MNHEQCLVHHIPILCLFVFCDIPDGFIRTMGRLLRSGAISAIYRRPACKLPVLGL